MVNITQKAIAAGDTSRDWTIDTPARHEINQAYGITAQTSISFEPLPEVLKFTSGFYRWEKDVRQVLESAGLPHIIDTKYLRPKKTDGNGQQWKTISMKAAVWMMQNISDAIGTELTQKHKSLVFADEVFEAIKSKMNATGILADIEKWDSFRNIRLADYPSVPDFITALLKLKKELAGHEITPRPYTLVLMMLSELRFESPSIMDGAYQWCARNARRDGIKFLRTIGGLEAFGKYLVDEFTKNENSSTMARVEGAVVAEAATNTQPAEGGSPRVKREYPEAEGEEDVPRRTKQVKTEN